VDSDFLAGGANRLSNVARNAAAVRIAIPDVPHM
jgi:hypothetical protein